MPAYEDLANRQGELIRKALAGSVFVAPNEAELPKQLTSGSGGELVPLPEGYVDLGYMTKEDGVTWSRETEASEVTSWGSFDPTRRDVTSNTTTVSFLAQETKRQTLAMYNSVEPSQLIPDSASGEVAFNASLRPSTKYYRMFVVSVDGAGDDAIYIARLLPRATVSEFGDQTWQDSEGAMVYEMTMTATPDSDAGYSIRHFFGGPGWNKMLTAMGFERPPSS